MKYTLSIIQLLLVVLTANAQTLSVSAPSNVQTGENFRLVYSVNTMNASDFRMANIPDGLELITGPYTSSQRNIQMVNGHTTSSSSITYTFIICANKPGEYTIPAARIKADGKSLTSQTAHIKVSGTASNNGGAPRMHEDDDNRASSSRQAGSQISGEDLFIKVSANKKKVHEQEPILLTYKVYTLVDLIQLEGKMPDLTGFHTQEVELPQQKSFHVENVNGRNYRCVTWSQYVMYPQMTGKLQIPSITFNGIVMLQNRNVDPFEAFFNGGSGYIEVKRTIKAPAVTIQVDPLPDRPANFSGGVGKFNISVQPNKTELRANDPVTVRVVVGGNGNLKLIKQPVVKFPKDFDQYDPKVTDKTRLTANGLEGNMVYDIIAVPRNQGEYTIPPIEFTYYDTDANQYKTIKSQPFTLKVAKGDGSSSDVADSEYKDLDIRTIKKDKTEVTTIDDMFFASTLYWLVIALIIASFIILMVLFRQRAIQNADIVGRKKKKANKVATAKLRRAKQLMDKQQTNEFYDEVLHALWGYIGDKLNMPVEQLTRDNIAERLAEHNVYIGTIEKFTEAIDECEFERYAPGDSVGNMNKTYTSAMTAITEIDNAMKSRRKRSAMKSLLILFMFMLPMVSNAVTKENADNEYLKGNYQQAIKDYQSILTNGVNADVYYNLGNAYYRTDNIAAAILAYERASILAPSDADIRFNLQMARSKTIDKMIPKSEMFFVTWYRALVNVLSVDGWANVAILSILLSLVMVLMYLFAERIILRKIGFFVSITFFVLFVLCNVFAYQQRYLLLHHTGAIVMTPSVTLKKTPASNSTNMGVIHEGTRVDITDDTMKDWKGVKLSDGREGWIPASHIEKI